MQKHKVLLITARLQGSLKGYRQGCKAKIRYIHQFRHTWPDNGNGQMWTAKQYLWAIRYMERIVNDLMKAVQALPNEPL